jgi:viroplasmin and RNaseH domain-containing protein
MAKNFYAVKYGRVPGIYECWSGGAEDAVKGFSGATYKGLNTVEECLAFLNQEEAPLYTNYEDAINNSVKPKEAITDSADDFIASKLGPSKQRTLLDVLRDKKG